MSKTGKTVLTIVLVVLILALVGIMLWGISGFGFGGWNRPALSCYGTPFRIGNINMGGGMLTGQGELPATAEKGSQFEIDMPGITAVSMDFIDEDVNVVEWDKKAYKVEQTSSSQLSDDDIMRFGVINGKFIAQSGKIGKNIMGIRPKSLITLYVPRGTVPYTYLSSTSGNVKVNGGTFDKLDLDSTSGELSAEKTKSGEMYASTTSGRIILTDVVANDLGTDTTSGTIDVKGDAGKDFNANTTSGDVRFMGNAIKAEADTTSGTIEISGNVESMEADTVSGSVTGNLNNPRSFDANSASGSIRFAAVSAAQLDKVSADSISGSVTVTLPGNAGFYVDYDSVSGKNRINGFMMNGDAVGNGRTHIEVDTTSGDLNVECAN